ncbi:MAG: hypothetical protein JWP88_235 [Flaviaesturariibacter sp.]|nr:hypothetical protein [Flaviaesturariibacter sp.]
MYPTYSTRFKLVNLSLFLLLLGVIYLNFFYKEEKDSKPVSAQQQETASLTNKQQTNKETAQLRSNN